MPYPTAAASEPVASMAAARPGVLVSAPESIPTARSAGTPISFTMATQDSAPAAMIITPSKI